MTERSETLQCLVEAAHRYHTAVAKLVAFIDRVHPTSLEWVRALHQHEVVVEQVRHELVAMALVLADEVTEAEPYVPDNQLTLAEMLPSAKA